jgi:hypothetical protein
MTNKNKIGTSTRIERIVEKVTAHYGTDIHFVGVKFDPSVGWIAKVKLFNFPSLSGMSTTSSEKALKRLERRIDKIIERYSMV